MKKCFTPVRQWLTVLLCCVLLIVFSSCIEIKKKPVISEGLEYQFNDVDMTCAVLGIGTCTDADLRIPETVNGYRVTSVAADAFLACNQITNVILPDGITTIGSKAFSHCDAITSVQFGTALTQIDATAFANCDLLQTVVFPERLLSIGDHAFALCNSLTSVTFPESIEQVGAGAFHSCNKLSGLTVPKKLTSIGNFAFLSCNSLQQISVSEENPVYHSAGNCLIDTESKKLLVGCKNSVIPNEGSVTVIGASSFESCHALKSLSIPSSIVTIEKRAFYGCNALETLTFSENLTEIGCDAFVSCSALKQITIPNSLKKLGANVFANCTALESVTFVSAPQQIDASAFENCKALKAVCISDLADWCKIQFQSSQSNPLYHAKVLYLNGEALQSIVIPDGVTALGDYLFVGCEQIKSISIPKSVTRIEPRALYAIGNNLEQIIVDKENPVYRVSNRCLIDIEQKTLVKGCKKAFIPDDGSVVQIGDYAFYGCDVSGIAIPTTVTTIWNYAFADCTGLTELSFHEGIRHIGTGAFKKCDTLTKITFPKSIQSVGHTPFSECDGLETVIYQGTVAEWKKLEKDYDFYSRNLSVTCTDGVYTKQ
ncbi:MAG: leucine-rich repeat domain-containing protein [Clostridia bacterium]|nr:leucine-rich repeat domain-containing protein [Clostridia bacterium]